MSHDEIQNDAVTSLDERDDVLSQTANNETFAKPAPSSTIRIKLNRSPFLSSENKENEDPNLINVSSATWRTLSE